MGPCSDLVTEGTTRGGEVVVVVMVVVMVVVVVVCVRGVGGEAPTALVCLHIKHRHTHTRSNKY